MYERFLKNLLAPLGVYNLTEGSVNGAELHALGTGLDEIAALLDWTEREGLLTDAEDEGLRRRESLFARRPAAVTTQQRRDAIAALLRIAGDSLTPGTINQTIQGCGIRAKALEMGGLSVRVIFPDTIGRPADYDQIQKIVLDILPCHLDVEFYLRYLTWSECHRAGYTWAFAEGKTWEEFMSAIP